MKWYKITGINNHSEPFVKQVKAGSKDICLVGYNGELFALSAYCPHAGANLSGGWCNNSKLICPFHRYSYDLHTGKGSEGQGDYINTYPVKVEDGAIYIGISSLLERVKEALKE